MISTILVPSDGSKISMKAAAYAVVLAGQLGACVVALSVIDKRMFKKQRVSVSKAGRGDEETADDHLDEIAESYVNEIKKMCDQSHVACKLSVKMGYPVDEILKEVKKSKADLIVMGSRGRSAASASVLGSVSYGVLHNDKNTPVLIVRG